MKRWKRGLILTLTGAMLLSAGGCGSSDGQSGWLPNSSESQETKTEFNLNSVDVQKKTNIINQLIENNFYYELDPEKQETEYYKGLIKGLNDKYATYYSPEEYKRVTEDDSGEYVGIGATVSKNQEEGTVYIVKPLKGSPAEEVGLLPEDVFVKIDDKELTTDMELEEVVTFIRGTANSTAHLVMYRPSEKKMLEFEVPRRKIENITVDYEMLENGIGYIKVDQFIETTFDQFKEAVDTLISQGAKGLIFDVRDNPGGLTNIVTEMVDYLVDDNQLAKGQTDSKRGLLLEMRNKSEQIIHSDYCKDRHSVDLPMAVLVNANSASSAEIFAGCFRDYEKGKLVGETTYGKGIVQQTFPLEDGSAVKMTIAGYFLPSGSNIHEKGIDPDVKVEIPSDVKVRLSQLPHGDDTQLAEAVKILGGDPLPKSPESTETGTTESTETGTTESTETRTTESTETGTTEE